MGDLSTAVATGYRRLALRVARYLQHHSCNVGHSAHYPEFLQSVLAELGLRT